MCNLINSMSDQRKAELLLALGMNFDQSLSNVFNVREFYTRMELAFWVGPNTRRNNLSLAAKKSLAFILPSGPKRALGPIAMTCYSPGL